MDIELLKRRAEAGSSAAKTILGLCYLYGDAGVKSDYVEAYRLLSTASQAGASRATVNLARMFAEGLGIPQDPIKAIELYESVAEVEFLAAIALGRTYAQGLGVAIDENRARKWYAAAVGFDEKIAGCERELSEAKAYLTG